MTMCRSLAWLGGGILFGSVYPPSKMIDFPSGDQSWAMLPAGGGSKRFPVPASRMCTPKETLFLVSSVVVVARICLPSGDHVTPLLLAQGYYGFSAPLYVSP